jgi:probable phosphoglycerate mutase
MTLVILVRHGENEFVKKGKLAGRLPGVHLNKRGCEQAQATSAMLAKRLQEQLPKAIYSSPLERAAETAVPIAQAFGLEVIIREGLIETNPGEWTGQTLKGLNRLKVWKTVQQRPSLFTFPGGETFLESQTRMVTELQALAGMHEEKDVIVCVSHSDPIRLAVAYFMGLPLDLFQRLVVSPASVTTLMLGPGWSTLVSLNCTPDLPPTKRK